MKERFFLVAAGVGGAVSASFDAAARHLFANDPYRLDLAATSARYGLIHAAALVGIAAFSRAGRGGIWTSLSGWLLVAGFVLFCLSLDLVAAGAPPDFLVATPVGGTCFIAGWLCLSAAGLFPGRAR